MATDFGQHTALLPLAKSAFAEHAYAPTEATLLSAAKNLARLEIPTSALGKPFSESHFDEMLKRLGHV